VKGKPASSTAVTPVPRRSGRSATLGSKLDSNGGFGPGFDVLRVALALSVVLWHQGPLMFGDQPPLTGPFATLGTAILPMFFGLSGFLVAGSALRLSLRDFLVNRGLRIFPALMVEIVLSAFVLGPIFTSLPLADYLGRRQTYHYLTNVVGWVNYQLPGVFKANPYDAVNWSLWTIPWELCCYGVMAAFILLGLLRRPALIVAVNLAIFVAIVAALPARASSVGAAGPAGVAVRILLAPGVGLLSSFLCGIALYLYREKIPHSRWAAALALGLLLLCAFVAEARAMGLAIFLPFALVYLAAYIGVMPMPALPVFRRGDYSYGIYLYGAPVQQAVRATFPALNDAAAYLVLALVAIVAFAAFSWHCIEKPILQLRRHFSFVARARGLAGAEEAEAGAAPARARGGGG